MDIAKDVIRPEYRLKEGAGSLGERPRSRQGNRGSDQAVERNPRQAVEVTDSNMFQLLQNSFSPLKTLRDNIGHREN